jgi:elongation factor 1-alpha
MITGASQADAAVLVIDASNGVQPQTKEHAFLSRTLGIKQLIIAINKMDAVNFAQDKYNETKQQAEALLKTIGYDISKIPFIPVSAYANANVTAKSDKTPWYNGPILIDAMNNLTVPEKPTNKPLRLPVQDVYTITGIGTVPVGRVETGVIKVGDSIIVMPSGAKGEVKTIEMHHQQMPKAEPGDNIGFNVRGLGKADVKRGDVIGLASNPPTVVKEFEAQIVVLQHPSAITVGYTPVFHCHTAQTACTITELIKKLDPKTGGVLEASPKFLKTGDVAIIKVVPTKPLCLESAKDFPELGRFAVRDMGMTVAAGMVLSVTPRT